MKNSLEEMLPSSWLTVSVEAIGLTITGNTPSTKDRSNYGSYIPYIKPPQLANCLVYTSEEFLSKKGADLARILPANSVLVSCIGNLGRTALNTVPVAFNQQINAIVPFGGIYPKFVYYQAQSHEFRSQLEEKATATTISILNKGNFEKIRLNIAPLDEQHRIVAKIETLFSELDKGIEALKAAREQLKVYRQVVLKHAFEGKLTARWREENKDKLETPEQLLARIQQERHARHQQQLQDWKTAVNTWESSCEQGKKPGKPRKSEPEMPERDRPLSLPDEWAWLSVGELNTDIFDGPFGSNLKSSDYVDAGVRVIRLENIGYLEFIEDKYSYVTEEKYLSLEKHTVRSGDLVFSSFITDGIRVAVLPDPIDRAINKADCFCIRVHGQSMRNDFLAAYFSTRTAYKQVEAEIHGIGRPRINTTQLKGFCIPVCCPEEQDVVMAQIEDALSVVDHIESEIDQELRRTETLRQSILKKAFSGQLVLQDPNDEPASALLERICAEKAGADKSPNKRYSKSKEAI